MKRFFLLFLLLALLPRAPACAEPLRDGDLKIAADHAVLMESKTGELLYEKAAHERVLYERLLRETAQQPVSQTLLVPETVRINRTEYAAWLDNRELLRSLGYDADEMGEDTLALRGLPVILGQTEAASCLRDSLDELAQFGRLDDYDKKLRIATTACKHAVKGGERVPEDELAWLVTEILSSRIPPTCPHGRPLMVTVTHTELDKRFRRIQQ